MANASGDGGGHRLTNFVTVDLTVEQMASGGFGLVFMGPNRLKGGGWRALKTLRPDLLARAPRLRELFVREGITWVSLWPHINLLYAENATMINDQPFLHLAYAKYGSLRGLLVPDLPFTLRLAWAQHIAAGLIVIHTPDPQMLREQPLVHRDLKPENVLIMEDERAVITDFGLAKAVEQAAAEDPGVLAMLATLDQQEEARLATAGGSGTAQADQRTRMVAAASRSRRYQTKRGAALGTLAYMPPEQWTDAALVGPPADIYAFGLILSELLAGRHGLLDLEAGADEAAWRTAHERGVPRPLRSGTAEDASRLPAEAEQLYQAMLAKRPEDRPQAGECLATLQRVVAAFGEQAYQAPDIYPRTDEHLWMRLGNVAITYDSFGLLDEALAWVERALTVPGVDPKLYGTHGIALAKLAKRAERAGQASEGERLAEQALAAFKAEEAAFPPTEEDHWMAMSNRANLLSDRGRYAEAEAAFASALAAIPNDGQKWCNRANNEHRWAISETRAGRRDVARGHVLAGLDHVARAIQLNPNDPGYLQVQQTLRALLAQLGG